MDYLEQQKTYWKSGYHAPNVEGFVFRLKPVLLDKFVNFSKKKDYNVLDFGCGEGSNVNYLYERYGFIPYGVDIAKIDIENCKKKYKKFRNNYKVIEAKPSLKDDFFNKKFDLIISIQTLYYLDNEDLKVRLESLKKMLKPGGLVFFTMMGVNHYYYKFYSEKKHKNGLTTINLQKDSSFKKRQQKDIYKHYINITKSEKHLVTRMSMFKKLALGFYDYSVGDSKLQAYHHTFLGKK